MSHIFTGFMFNMADSPPTISVQIALETYSAITKYHAQKQHIKELRKCLHRYSKKNWLF